MNLLRLLLAACVLGNVAAHAAVITGQITQDTTLTGVNQLQGTAVVAPGVTLTLAPGSTLQLRAAGVLEVRGQMIAEGTQAQPILFTRETAGQTWKQIAFRNAANSRFKFCTFEFANSAGTHLDYYSNVDCATPRTNRPYHEAILLRGTHVDFESCTFRNLPGTASTAEGDAVAVISDDPEVFGTSSATFKTCTFTSIGQGIHTRFSYILVEGCTFTGHRGDNDDIDMYGESTPPPMIRYNSFLNPVADDMINPTRCSAIIFGNFISGGTDHGIVLRDTCQPVVMNNVIANCSAALISVQNTCNALIANNTLVNSARGVRFFDHTSRHGVPYCLTPGGGRATLINNIIWNCTNSLTLENSSTATVTFCDVQGGQASATVGAGSTLTWGAGNISVNPMLAANTHRPADNSPVVDAGTDPVAIEPRAALAPALDLLRVPRPLDGNGDGTAVYDMGAHEILRAASDSNADGIPDGWAQSNGFNPLDPTVAGGNPDGDSATTRDEYLADTNPNNSNSAFRIEALTLGPADSVSFQSSANRRYTLFLSLDLTAVPMWLPVPGQVDVPGTGGLQTLTDGSNDGAPQKFLRVGVRP